MDNSTLLYISIIGYAAISVVALLLNDAIHRYAHRQQRKHYEHMLANMSTILDLLHNSNKGFLAREDADLSDFEEVVAEAQKSRRV